MDSARFDTLIRGLAAPASRRVAGRFLAGLGLTGVLAQTGAASVGAAKDEKGKKRKKPRKQKPKRNGFGCVDVGGFCAALALDSLPARLAPAAPTRTASASPPPARPRTARSAACRMRAAWPARRTRIASASAAPTPPASSARPARNSSECPRHAPVWQRIAAYSDATDVSCWAKRIISAQATAGPMAPRFFAPRAQNDTVLADG
jgi:hypothetical protein